MLSDFFCRIFGINCQWARAEEKEDSKKKGKTQDLSVKYMLTEISCFLPFGTS